MMNRLGLEEEKIIRNIRHLQNKKGNKAIKD